MLQKQLSICLFNEEYFNITFDEEGFHVFFKAEQNHVCVIVIVNCNEARYLTTDLYQEAIKRIKDKFHQKGILNVHMLSIFIAEQKNSILVFLQNNPFSWYINSQDETLHIFENQVSDFYGLKSKIEYALEHPDQLEIKNSQVYEMKKGVKLQNDIKYPWVTIGFFFICIVVYLLDTISEHRILNAGSISVVNLLQNKEYYRLVSAIFLHGSIDHIFSNMLLLLFAGKAVEESIGKVQFFILFMGAGILGNVASCYYEYVTKLTYSSIGASGAIFGIVGALLLLVLLKKGEGKSISIFQMGFMILYSIYSGLRGTNINNIAHIGGLISGFILAWLLCNFDSRRKKYED